MKQYFVYTSKPEELQKRCIILYKSAETVLSIVQANLSIHQMKQIPGVYEVTTP